MNKQVLVDLLKEEDTEKSTVITTEQFFSTLEGIAAPVDSDNKVKLLAIYDKKGEGKINYNDFIAEQKFVHAVSLKTFLCAVCGMLLSMCVCVRERGDEGESSHATIFICVDIHVHVFDDLFLMCLLCI